MMNTSSPISGSPTSCKNEITVASRTSISPAVARVAAPASKAAAKSKPRKRVNTAEKRHQHNAIERQRRETLNSKFLTLARLLPALASHRRPSKSAIVNGSITHLMHQREQRLLAAKLLRRLCTEHEALLGEVNDWRKTYGHPAKEVTSAWNEDVEEICSVEKEVFGTFASMGADGDDDDEEDIGVDAVAEQPTIMPTFATVNGLLDPRPSTALDAFQAHTLFANNMPPVADNRAASVNGLDWSHDFAFAVNQNLAPHSLSGSASSSARASLPFNAFMNDPVDQSSSDSPSNSHQGTVLTPPMTADSNIYTYTPSPRSSHSVPEDNTGFASRPWDLQQMLFLQQQAQFHQQTPQYPQMPFTSFPSQHPTQSATFGTDAFTQSLLSSMFPQNAATAEQVHEWRKQALGNLLGQQYNLSGGARPSADDLKNAVRTGMGFGLGMSGMWGDGQNQSVEGF